MAVANVSVNSVIDIMRNATGRVDPNDPLFTDTIMAGYLNDYIQLEHPQEIRIFQNKSWWEFTLVGGTSTTSQSLYNVNLDQISNNYTGGPTAVSTIEPPAYVSADADGGTDDVPGFELFWYQDPTEFYRVWPDTQTYQPSRPTDVLYYNNQLIFRNPPDKNYNFKVACYRIEDSIITETNGVSVISQFISNPYFNRYLAYGAALDILSDYGEMDKYAEVFQVFKRYKNQVVARTWDQYENQRTTPNF